MAGQRERDKLLAYRIQVRGHLDQRWADWFNGLKIVYNHRDTILTGCVADQSALHGVLAKIRDLGLFIILVERLNDAGDNDETS